MLKRDLKEAIKERNIYVTILIYSRGSWKKCVNNCTEGGVTKVLCFQVMCKEALQKKPKKKQSQNQRKTDLPLKVFLKVSKT